MLCYYLEILFNSDEMIIICISKLKSLNMKKK